MRSSSEVVRWSEGSRQEKYAYHAHDYREVLSILAAKEEGLNEEEVQKRQEKYGLNEFSKKESEGLFTRVIKNLRSPLTLVLLADFIDSLSRAVRK